MLNNLKKSAQKAPKEPGVYIFKRRKEQLYIGKAGNLRNRIRNYFLKRAYTPFLEHLLKEADGIEFETTESEIEALLLESELIKKLQPKYNIMLRDDKQYFYVVFTHSTNSGQAEEFSKIFLTHQPLAAPSKSSKEGPFTDGTALRMTLRLLRRIFPYCTCTEKHHNFCLNYHIGKCLGVCCLKINQKSNIKNKNDILKIKNIYKENIKTIKDILSGRRKSLVKNLRKELNQSAENQEFEKAIELRNKIERLEKIFANAKIIQDIKYKIQNTKPVLKKLTEIFKLPLIPRRIEGYDISNIQGDFAVGAMAVFTHSTGSGHVDYRPDKNEYRKFKIRFKKTPDDTAMLKEVLFRRFNHPEWPYPDLIFIDGGKSQLNAAKKTFSKPKNINFERSSIINMPIISLAKGKNEVFSTTLKNPIPLKKLPTEVQNSILQIDREAHRFAISYYRKIHRKFLLK